MSTFIPKVFKLSERVVRVLGMNPGMMTLQGTNTYLIGKGNEVLLLDTGDGMKPEYIENLKSTLQENGMQISAILVSHWHYDHVGGVPLVLDIANKDCNVYKFADENHDQISDKWKFNYIKDGHEFKLEDTTLRVLHTPGHTEDHVVVHLKEENAIFSGDCILGEGTAVFTDLWSYINSLRLILSIKPSVIYPGHGPVVEDTITRITHYIEHRMLRENQILQCLPSKEEEAITVESIVKIVYADTPVQLHVAAANNASLHLFKLVKDKKAAVIDGELPKFWAI